jgi:hypothetical protein
MCVGVHHLITLSTTTLNIVNMITFLTHAHAQITVIYTYFSASFTVVAQDEDTKMYFIFQ